MHVAGAEVQDMLSSISLISLPAITILVACENLSHLRPAILI
jgi:hypothetical protein